MPIKIFTKKFLLNSFAIAPLQIVKTDQLQHIKIGTPNNLGPKALPYM